MTTRANGPGYYFMSLEDSMYKLNIEHRILKDKSTMPDNIARHIQEYQVYGRVAVVSDRPHELLREIEAAWHDLEQETRDEIDQIANGQRRTRLVNLLVYMPQCSFTDRPPIEDSFEKVQVATIEQFIEWPPQCQTMFVTYPVETSQLYRATGWMPKYGLVVLYTTAKGER